MYVHLLPAATSTPPGWPIGQWRGGSFRGVPRIGPIDRLPKRVVHSPPVEAQTSGLSEVRQGRWVEPFGRVGRFLVGAVFVVAAGSKALDPAAFARQIAGHGWLPEAWTPAVAIALIAVELLLGSALVLAVASRAAAALIAGLLLLFVGVMAEAWLTGRQVDCGCFGALVERGPGEVVLEDLGLLALLLPTLWSVRKESSRLRRGAVASVTAVGLALAFAAPYLPLDGLVTKLAPGATLESIGMDALLPRDGAYVVALLDLNSEATTGAVAGLNDLATAVPEAEVVAFAAAGAEERAAFGWSKGAGFRVEEIGAGAVGALARKLPRYALVVDGRVTAIWNDAPPAAAAIRGMMGGSST